MRIYILNRSMSIIDLIEGVTSFIWTERFQDHGDATLVVPITLYPYTSLTVGNYIQIDDSEYLMEIETVSRSRSTEGSSQVKVTAVDTVFTLLDNRMVVPNDNNNDYWETIGSPARIATELVRRICVDGELTSQDIYTLLDVLTNDSITDSVEHKIPPQSLYKAVRDLCVATGAGFRMYFVDGRFKFRVYRSDDRSDSVVFSSHLNNLKNTAYVHSRGEDKNVAYVMSGSRVRVVQKNGGYFSDRNRRGIYVNADDIENPRNATLDFRGRTELAKLNGEKLIDGSVEPKGPYEYKNHYGLGDLVTIEQPQDNVSAVMQITEYIRSHDVQGHHEYPTFTLKEV